MNLTPWQGGKTGLRNALIAAVGGLGLTAVGAFVDPRRAAFSYLVAFTTWCAVAVASLILLGALHAASAKWPVVARRFMEHLPSTIVLFAVLFVPVWLARGSLFIWVSPPAGLDPVMEHAIHHKHPYLNTAFFTWRAVGYFAVWILVAYLLRSWSLKQDQSGDPGLTLKQRRLGAGALPLLALTMTFASFDWMMSLDPRFFSTIFGVYWFAGGFMSAFAVIIIAAAMTRNDPNGFGHHLSAEHLHSLGKFLLAFTAFWAYIAFSQFMLIWIANVPEEVPWYVLRINGGWKWVGAFLAVFHFLVPFFLLLSRDRKRDPVRLARVAVWLLVVQWVDVYWLVMPHLDAAGPKFTLWDLAAWVGVGGAAAAFLILRMRGSASVPVRDPYLDDSLRYLPQ
ncbi:MAG: hypothetical protein U0229_20150 [Anaeromyxobacter sp.]